MPWESINELRQHTCDESLQGSSKWKSIAMSEQPPQTIPDPITLTLEMLFLSGTRFLLPNWIRFTQQRFKKLRWFETIDGRFGD